MILANAIYFKGKWVEPFKKDRTKPQDFHLSNGQTTQTPMMVQDGHFQYQENPKFQAIKLPYNGGLQMEVGTWRSHAIQIPDVPGRYRLQGNLAGEYT